MFLNPFLESVIEASEKILISGCGGGYDFLSGIPLFEYLSKTSDKECVLGNLSFTSCDCLDPVYTEEIYPNCFEVTKSSVFLEEYCRGGGKIYFPEKYFAKFYFDEFEEDVPVYSFYRRKDIYQRRNSSNGINVDELQECYEFLVEKLGIDTIIVVDGGNDSLNRGDEEECGTVEEDMTTLASVYKVRNVETRNKYLTSIGFGVDRGVHFSDVLENISNLISTSDESMSSYEDDKNIIPFFGCFSLIKESEEFDVFRRALEYVNLRNGMISIVGSSICNAVEGKYGNYQSSIRTKHSELYINPLMGIYWNFSLAPVVEQVYFLERCIRKFVGKSDVGYEWEKYRKKLKKRGKLREYKNFPH